MGRARTRKETKPINPTNFNLYSVYEHVNGVGGSEWLKVLWDVEFYVLC